MLRPLVATDFAAWSEVRIRNEAWLTKWEPMRLIGHPDPVRDREAFALRCAARERERQLGAGYGFGVFVDGQFAGEINVNAVHRGPFQNAYIG
jgi:[ribosomal protein S5]-alanine N-acetyltransferase